MIYGNFFKNRPILEAQYRSTQWITGSGLEPEQLRRACDRLADEWEAAGLDRSLIKARLFAFILDNAQLAVVPEDLFQDHIRHECILQKLRSRWMREIRNGILAEPCRRNQHCKANGVFDVHEDFGHTVPDWYAILHHGFPGLLERLRDARQAHIAAGTLTDSRAVYYEAGQTVYESAIRYLSRLAAQCQQCAETARGDDRERLLYCARDLQQLTVSAPQTLHQALQLVFIFHILQEEIEGERLRSLGGLDRLFARFMEHDLENGILTKENITELWQTLFQKFHALTGDTLYGEPMFLGGLLPDGSCAVNKYSYWILDAYDALHVANPKFHIRTSQKTPPEFLKKVLDCIRRGNSSFVFVSDECTIPMMMEQVGATYEEACEWVPVGCYEPGILGREVACTCNGGISLPKALELVLERSGPAAPATFDALMAAVKEQITCITKEAIQIICQWEEHYMQLNPSPLFSGTMAACVESGTDAYAGGAQYNSSSLYGYGIATVADSLAMLKKFVYDTGALTLPAFAAILKNNWEGHELLRLRMRKDPDKFGNNRDLPDEIACAVSKHFAQLVNRTPNNRGGHFKAALISIDFNYTFGKQLGASADGRLAGEPISRNAGASSTMDRNGVTAHIQSVTKLNLNEYPTGSVLDIMLHPTAVAGEEGLEVFYRLLRTYFALGGFAIHGNVMDAAVLRDAQKHPENYPNLQVRVCGWNVYFVNLSRQEQNEFIARAEAS